MNTSVVIVVVVAAAAAAAAAAIKISSVASEVVAGVADGAAVVVPGLALQNQQRIVVQVGFIHILIKLERPFHALGLCRFNQNLQTINSIRVTAADGADFALLFVVDLGVIDILDQVPHFPRL